MYSISTGATTIVTEDDLATATWTASETGVTNGTLQSYTGSNGVYTQDTAASTVVGSVNFNLNTAFAYKVEITFATVSNSGVTVSYNDTVFVNPESEDNITLIVAPGTESTIVAGETYTFTYYVLLDDATQEVTDATIPALAFEVTKAV